MKKVLIWDFNGTIIDDVDYCIEIENKMLRDRNMDFISTYEQYRRDFCFPVIDYYYKIGYTFEEESYADISDEFNDMYNSGFDTLQLMDGFEELIQQAKKDGYEEKEVRRKADEKNRLAVCADKKRAWIFSEYSRICYELRS